MSEFIRLDLIENGSVTGYRDVRASTIVEIAVYPKWYSVTTSYGKSYFVTHECGSRVDAALGIKRDSKRTNRKNSVEPAEGGVASREKPRGAA